MRALGYAFVVFLALGVWMIWQIARRASAGTQAIINPERYAIQKVAEMQQDVFDAGLLSAPPDSNSYPKDRWDALVKYDTEISTWAEQLRPYGDVWISKMGKAYFDLQEDRSYLPNIVRTLLKEAEDEAAQAMAVAMARAEQEANQRWVRMFSRTAHGEVCTEASGNILRRAESLGYALAADSKNVITATKEGRGIRYLYSNSDIAWFGQHLGDDKDTYEKELFQAARGLAERLRETHYGSDAVALVRKLNGRVAYGTTGVFRGDLVVSVLGDDHHFKSDYEMAQWVVRTIVPKVLLS